jgi:hypothetical protein
MLPVTPWCGTARPTRCGRTARGGCMPHASQRMEPKRPASWSLLRCARCRQRQQQARWGAGSAASSPLPAPLPADQPPARCTAWLAEPASTPPHSGCSAGPSPGCQVRAPHLHRPPAPQLLAATHGRECSAVLAADPPDTTAQQPRLQWHGANWHSVHPWCLKRRAKPLPASPPHTPHSPA